MVDYTNDGGIGEWWLKNIRFIFEKQYYKIVCDDSCAYIGNHWNVCYSQNYISIRLLKVLWVNSLIFWFSSWLIDSE
jgi:hypothetical protein